jgi:hypothetical protein
VSGCATNEILSPYAAPGKYDFLDCPSITERIKTTSARERQLNELMTRASEAGGGFIVNAIAYQMTSILLAQTFANCVRPPKQSTVRSSLHRQSSSVRAGHTTGHCR